MTRFIFPQMKLAHTTHWKGPLLITSEVPSLALCFFHFFSTHNLKNHPGPVGSRSLRNSRFYHFEQYTAPTLL
jgi:hypothetical protein